MTFDLITWVPDYILPEDEEDEDDEHEDEDDDTAVDDVTCDTTIVSHIDKKFKTISINPYKSSCGRLGGPTKNWHQCFIHWRA